MRGLLRNYGLKVGAISRGRFEHRIRELTADNPMLFAATEPMLRARISLRQELAGLERRVRQLAQDDPVCHRLMSMPGVGAVVALTYLLQLMIPCGSHRRRRSGHGSASRLHATSQANATSLAGSPKQGDANLRRALCQAATVMMHRGRSTWLRTWAVQVARRRGAKRAMVALARRISVILHRIWTDGTTFRSEIHVPHAT